MNKLIIDVRIPRRKIPETFSKSGVHHYRFFIRIVQRQIQVDLERYILLSDDNEPIRYWMEHGEDEVLANHAERLDHVSVPTEVYKMVLEEVHKMIVFV